MLALAYSPDSRRLAVAGRRQVSILDAASWEPVHTWTPHHLVRALSWLDDDELSFAGAGPICVARASTREPTRELPFEQGHAADTHALACSPDRSLLASGHRAQARLWRPSSGRRVRPIEVEGDACGLAPSAAGW